MTALPTRSLLGLAIAGMILAGPILYRNSNESTRRNFRVVDPGKVYRSGQLDREGLRRAVNEYGIRSVITLRFPDAEGEPAPDEDEEKHCAELGLRHHRIRPGVWSGPGAVPASESIDRFLRVVGDPEAYPILIHCFAGIHRTGAYCAIYRMERNGWHPEQALREMRECGYTNLGREWDVSTYLREYEARGLLGLKTGASAR